MVSLPWTCDTQTAKDKWSVSNSENDAYNELHFWAWMSKEIDSEGEDTVRRSLYICRTAEISSLCFNIKVLNLAHNLCKCKRKWPCNGKVLLCCLTTVLAFILGWNSCWYALRRPLKPASKDMLHNRFKSCRNHSHIRIL